MRSFFLWVFLGMVVVAFAGCANGLVGQGATGTVTTKLIVAPGVDETTIDFSITGNGIDPRTGTIDVVSNPVTAEVAGIPVGSGYTITLATADGICTGSATFDVVENQTTTVTVPIQCTTTPPKRGNVLVNGTFLTCPTVSSMVVSPTSVAVGSTIQVNASAKDLGQGTLTYAWTATSDGTFANPAVAKTTYMCATTGTKTLTITVSNVGCTDSLSVDVTCSGGGCGNGVLDAGEKCDTGIAPGNAGACPTSCNPGTDPCNPVKLQGTGCQAACVATPITVAVCGDGCVTSPETCEPPNTATCDANCKSVTCGNGVLDAGEKCDTGIAAGNAGACPTSCNPGTDPCNPVKLQGTGCQAACVATPITVAVCGDGCVTSPTEQCEPPNTSTCNANCQSISCFDMTGTWATHVSVVGSLVAPDPVGTQTANIEVIQRLVVTKNGNDLDYQFDICKLVTATAPGASIAFETLYPAAMLATLTTTAVQTGGATVCVTKDASVQLPEFVINTGWAGPSSKPTTIPTCPTIPASPLADIVCPPVPPPSPAVTCSTAIDTDNDGYYGVSLESIVAGSLYLCVGAGLTIDTTLSNMVATDATTNTGITNFSTVGYAYGNNLGFGAGDITVTPPANVPVTAKKISATAVPCSEVITHCSGAICQ